MVESTTTDKQNAAQVNQQQDAEALRNFMLDATVNFAITLGKTEKVEGSYVKFKVGGVNYSCDKRKTADENNVLWIDTAPPDRERFEYAVFDARTRKLKASLFLTARQLFDILAHLEAKHAALFD